MSYTQQTEIIKAQLGLLDLQLKGWDKDPPWVKRDNSGRFSETGGGSKASTDDKSKGDADGAAADQHGELQTKLQKIAKPFAAYGPSVAVAIGGILLAKHSKKAIKEAMTLIETNAKGDKMFIEQAEALSKEFDRTIMGKTLKPGKEGEGFRAEIDEVLSNAKKGLADYDSRIEEIEALREEMGDRFVNQKLAFLNTVRRTAVETLDEAEKLATAVGNQVAKNQAATEKGLQKMAAATAVLAYYSAAAAGVAKLGKDGINKSLDASDAAFNQEASAQEKKYKSKAQRVGEIAAGLGVAGVATLLLGKFGAKHIRSMAQDIKKIPTISESVDDLVKLLEEKGGTRDMIKDGRNGMRGRRIIKDRHQMMRNSLDKIQAQLDESTQDMADYAMMYHHADPEASAEIEKTLAELDSWQAQLHQQQEKVMDAYAKFPSQEVDEMERYAEDLAAIEKKMIHNMVSTAGVVAAYSAAMGVGARLITDAYTKSQSVKKPETVSAAKGWEGDEDPEWVKRDAGGRFSKTSGSPGAADKSLKDSVSSELLRAGNKALTAAIKVNPDYADNLADAMYGQSANELRQRMAKEFRKINPEVAKGLASDPFADADKEIQDIVKGRKKSSGKGIIDDINKTLQWTAREYKKNVDRLAKENDIHSKTTLGKTMGLAIAAGTWLAWNAGPDIAIGLMMKEPLPVILASTAAGLVGMVGADKAMEMAGVDNMWLKIGGEMVGYAALSIPVSHIASKRYKLHQSKTKGDPGAAAAAAQQRDKKRKEFEDAVTATYKDLQKKIEERNQQILKEMGHSSWRDAIQEYQDFFGKNLRKDSGPKLPTEKELKDYRQFPTKEEIEKSMPRFPTEQEVAEHTKLPSEAELAEYTKMPSEAEAAAHQKKKEAEAAAKKNKKRRSVSF
jgi:hypothetical protein